MTALSAGEAKTLETAARIARACTAICFSAPAGLPPIKNSDFGRRKAVSVRPRSIERVRRRGSLRFELSRGELSHDDASGSRRRVAEFDNGLRAAGRVGVEEPTIGMRLTSRVEESDERPGKPVNIFVFD